MQAVKRFIEWYLGVPAAEAGEGTAWNFSYQTPWPAWVPAWGVLLLALAVIGYVIFIYSRDAQRAPVWQRGVLISLRLAVIGMVLLFLTQLTLSVDRTGLPFVAVLLDVSGSMGLEDEYTDKNAQSTAKSLMKEGGFSRPTRLNLAKSILTRDDGRFLKTLLKNHKLRVYRFSDNATVVGRSESLRSEDVDELLPLLHDLEADGEQTRPGPAVQKVLDDFRGTPPSAILIISDGITTTTDADKLSVSAEAALAKLVPIYALGMGSEEPARDIHLYDMLADEVAFVDDPISFTAKLKAYGYEGQRINVVLKDKNSNEELSVTGVTIPADGEPAKVELTFTPSREGEFDFVLAAPALRKETNRDNNAETRHVSIRRQRIRVLLADSLPRYEFRYVKHLLERDKTIELDTVLQEADREYVAEDQTALDHFPVKRSELQQYDVVIFGDVNLSYLSSGTLENLQDFVRDSGGAIIFVAGPNFNPLTYQGTPLEIMLPIQLEGARAPSPDVTIAEGFRPNLTIPGRKGSSIFRFAGSERDSLEVWNGLPELYWLLETPELTAGAIVLAEHPTRNGKEGRLPVISILRYGAGKVIFQATDELWRWRFRVGDLYYGRYWVHAIRYLTRSKLLGKDRTAELTADRVVYQRGESVNLRLRFLDERLAPTENDGVTVMVERRGDVQRPISLGRIPQAAGVFEGRLANAVEGTYHAWVVTPSFKNAPPATDFRVEAPLRELRKRSLDRAELTQAAKITHGKYYSLASVEDILKDIPPGQAVALETQDPLPLWNRWEALILFASLLLTEWLLRKRCRLI